MAAIASSNNTNTSFLISDSESDFIASSCRVGCRLDGRSCTEFRPYQILVQDPHPLSHGSARMVGSVGHASHEQVHLTCSVKAELVRPSPKRPHQGLCELFLTHGGTFLPNNTHRHMKRTLEQTQGILTNLLADRIVDTYALCLVPHECVWKLSIDVLVLEAAGGALMDCAARLMAATLQATKLPHVVMTPNDNTTKSTESSANSKTNSNHTIVVDGDVAKAHAIPLAGTGRVVTLAILQDIDLATQRPLYSIVADPHLAEETCALALVHVCIHSAPMATGRAADDTDQQQQQQHNSIVGLHKTQPGALPLSLLPEITATALQVVEDADAAFVTQRDDSEDLSTTTNTPKTTMPEQHFSNASTILSEQFQWLVVED